jgi:hypothetical protein
MQEPRRLMQGREAACSSSIPVVWRWSCQTLATTPKGGQ